MNDCATTRRHFLHASAALAASGLCIGSASAGAGTPPRPFTAFAIEVDGVGLGVLDTLQLPEYVATPGAKGEAAFGVGPFRGSVAVASPQSKLLEWILSLSRGKGDAKSGTLHVVDDRAIVKRHIGWKEGRITEIGLPVLSSDGERFIVELAWQAAEISHDAKASKRAAPRAPRGTRAPKTARNGTWNASRFRLKGLPIDSADILKITLPTIASGVPGPKVGNLTVELAGAARESIHADVQKMIADGRLLADEYLDLSVELLDPARAETLGAVQLYGCGLHSFREPTFVSSATGDNRYTLTFSVERCDLTF